MALLQDMADVAVHSMKDVPMEFPKDCNLQELKREDPTDALVSNKFSNLGSKRNDNWYIQFTKAIPVKVYSPRSPYH